MTEQATYNCSFRCFFPSESTANYSMHYQRLPLSDIARWLEAYKFTHPNCQSVSVKVWFADNGVEYDSAE